MRIRDGVDDGMFEGVNIHALVHFCRHVDLCRQRRVCDRPNSKVEHSLKRGTVAADCWVLDAVDRLAN